MRYHEKNEAKALCEMVRRAARRTIRSKDGLIVGYTRAKQILLDPEIAARIERGILCQYSPLEQIAGIQVTPDTSRPGCAVLLFEGGESFCLRLEGKDGKSDGVAARDHEKDHAAKRGEEIREPTPAPTRDVVRDIVRQVGSKDPGILDWIGDT